MIAIECKVCDVLPTLSDHRRAVITQALASTLGAEKLARILRKHGLQIGRPSIKVHRAERHTTT